MVLGYKCISVIEVSVEISVVIVVVFEEMYRIYSKAVSAFYTFIPNCGFLSELEDFTFQLFSLWLIQKGSKKYKISAGYICRIVITVVLQM